MNSIILGSVLGHQAWEEIPDGSRIAHARNPSSYTTADAPKTGLFE